MMLQKVIGREDLKLHIENAYQNLLNKDKDVILVKGEAGIGKTFAITRTLDLKKDVKVIACKQMKSETSDFDLIKDIVNKLFTELLMLPNDIFNSIRYNLMTSLGADIGYFYYFSNLFSKIFNEIKPKKINDYGKEKYKIRKSMRLLFKIITNEIFPVCIFFDDVQWCDFQSIDIIKTLIKDKEVHCLFIISYRNGFSEFSKEENIYKTITLNSFTEKEIEEIIIIHTTPNIQNLKYLSRYIYSTTLGNPFFVVKSIEELKENRIIEAEKVYTHRFSAVKISEHVNGIMLSTINRLTVEEKQVLHYFACLFGSIKKNIAYILFDHISDVVASLIAKNIIFETQDKYAFTHDIILEYMQSSLSKNQSQNINHEIITVLEKENVDISEFPYNIYDSNIDLWDPNHSETRFNIVYRFAKESFHNQSYKASQNAIKTLNSVLAKGLICVSERKELEIKILFFKCKYMLGDLIEAEKGLKQLDVGCKDISLKLIIKDALLSFYAYLGNDDNVFITGKEMLHLLGFKYDVLQTADLLRQLAESYPLTEDFINGNDYNITDLYVLYRIMPSVRIISADDFFYIMTAVAQISTKQKFSKYTLIGYIAVSFVMCSILDDYERGRAFSDIVLRNLNYILEDDLNNEIISFYFTFVHHHYNDLRETTKLLEQNNKKCLENGFVSHFSYTLASLLFAHFSIGININQSVSYISERLDELSEITPIENTFISSYVSEMMTSYIIEFKNEPKKNDKIKEVKGKDLLHIWFNIIGLYLKNDLEYAYKRISLITRIFDEAKGHIVYADVNFIAGLIRIEYNNRIQDKNKQKENKEEIIRIYNFFKQIVENFEENHFSRYLFIKAMYENEFGNKYLTNGLITEGIKLAQEKDNVLLVAIGNVLLYKTCVDNMKLKQFYSKEIAHYLKLFGADIIADLYSGEKKQITDVTVDAKTLTKQDMCIYILDTLSDSYNCKHCAILLNDNEKLKIAFENEVNTKEYTTLIDLDYKRTIKKELLTFSFRTKDEIISKANGIFIKCTPLKVSDNLIGIIYLEYEEAYDTDITLFLNEHMSDLIIKLCEQDKKDEIINTTILTVREIEILKLLEQGKSNRDISEQEKISIGTVKSHLSNIYSKLEVSSRMNAIAKAKDLNIL